MPKFYVKIVKTKRCGNSIRDMSYYKIGVLDRGKKKKIGVSTYVWLSRREKIIKRGLVRK